MAEAGWYYVEGDPPGTVRRWNGTAWIGFPIPDPSTPVGMHGAHKHARLSPKELRLSAANLLALLGLAGLFVFTAARIWRDVDSLPTTASADRRRVIVPLSELGDYVDNIWLLIFALMAGVLITAVVFIAWIRAAASAAEIHRYKGSRRRSTERSPLLMVLQVLVFGIFAPIWWVLRAALAGIASGTGNTGLFGIVSDTAMASSVNPQTGVSEIEPLKILAWWALWWGPMLVAAGAWIWVFLTGPIRVNALHTVVQLHAILFGLLAISLVCIMITVTQITSRLR